MQFLKPICWQLLIVLVAAFPLAAAAQPATMKAIVLHQSGGPEVLKYEEAPRPQPKDDQVLIRVMAAGVNPVDVFIREGRSNQFPLIPGMDVAGVVEQTGDKVTKFKRGNAIYAYLSFEEQGGYAEFAGTFAVQIAKARGAKVIATASTANQDLLKQLGVDQPIDYTTTKFDDVVKDVDVVLNAVRGDTLARSYGVVKKGGIIVSITGPPDPAELDKHGIRGTGLGAHPDAKILEELAKLIDAGKIRPIVSAVMPIVDVAKAHEQIASRHTRGKIVLKVAEAPKE